MKQIHVFGGGTIQHVRNHLAICAPAYGGTANKIANQLIELGLNVHLELTKMACSKSKMETNEDVADRVNELLNDQSVKAIVFNVALCDFTGKIDDIESGKYAERLKSRSGDLVMNLSPAPKILASIKANRPDIFLVGFKTTAGADHATQLALCNRQIEETGADIVFANDTVTRSNILVANNFHEFGQRDYLISTLAQMINTSVK
jgi:phosphopantothenoylcysteine decarboxylase/phosphopantothenate--cysteine ligase